MEKCKKCGSEKFYLLPRKEGENINDAAMVAQRCVQCNFFKRWCPKTEKHPHQNTKKEINILCVEDGSVDVESLENEGLHDGKVVIYRQGANPPFVLKLKTDDGELKSEQNKVAVEKLEEVLKKVKQVVIVTDDDNDDYSVITLWGLKKVINSMIKELKGESDE